ncbi:MAG: OmpA family protein [Gemmatimonadales bacterium]
MKNAVFATAVMSTLVLAACHSSTPVASNPTPQPNQDSAAPATMARTGTTTARTVALTDAERQRMHADSVRAQVKGDMSTQGPGATSWGLAKNDSTALADRIHFDYDRADLSPEDLGQLDAKRQVLVAHPGLVIEIAGNADERGPDEYNLALGERRAAAAKRWLLAAGIAPSRISIVSWGEERPLEAGHEESSWQKNRRDEFLVVRSSQ